MMMMMMMMMMDDRPEVRLSSYSSSSLIHRANPVLNLNIDTTMDLDLDGGSSDVDKVRYREPSPGLASTRWWLFDSITSSIRRDGVYSLVQSLYGDWTPS